MSHFADWLPSSNCSTAAETVPFIARYRKEATGNLDEVQILSIEESLAYFRDLASRRETIWPPSPSRAS